MSFIQNGNNNGNSQGRNSNNTTGAQAQVQPDQTDKEGMHEEQQDSQQQRQGQGQGQGQELSKDSVTSELTAIHHYPFLPLGISGSAATMTTAMTTVSIDATVNSVATAAAAIEATTASLGDEDFSVGSDIDTSTTGKTTKGKRLAATMAAAVDKTHAAVSGASLPLISFSSDFMTDIAVDDDTARSKSTEDEKEIPAQPSSSPSSSSPSPSFSLLCRTFKQNSLQLSQDKTTLEQQHQKQAAPGTSTLAPCPISPSSPSSPSSLSTSTSSTFVEGSLDEVLLTALQNRQDRLFLLKLEREYCNFIEDPSKKILEFPWLNSYFRMMIHRSAIYYRLARTVDAAQKKIVLSKTEHTAIPALRFQELVEEEEDVPVRSFKVLRRAPPRPVSACEAREPTTTAPTIPGAASSAPTKSSPWQEPGGQLTGSGSTHRRGTGGTLEQREAAYAKARARIFDTGDEGEREKENDHEENEQPCQGVSSILKEEPRRSSSATSWTSSTVRTCISTVDSLSKLDLSQGHNQGQRHNKARSDITRRTSTSSTISSSSSSSGTTMADISARSDFVGSWMMSGSHSMPHSSSGMYDYRGGARSGM
ncbi:R3H domain-containing protein 2, partial [Linnemannia schmuckeri]